MAARRGRRAGARRRRIGFARPVRARTVHQYSSPLLRSGHKGADAIRPGNTLESFAAAVDSGVDLIEFDVLRPRADFADGSDWRAAPAGPERIVVARRRREQMRKKIAAVLLAGAFALSVPAAAFGAPDFGPGNSSKGPNDGGAKCHPPGQTVDEPGCK